MHIENLSLYIITLNEEKRLPKVLDSVKGLVDEIVVVDSGSVDRTGEIAAKYGAKFLFHEWESVGHQVKWAEEQCSYRWVLRLDADEVLSEELALEIGEVRRSGTKEGYVIKISEMVVGRKRPNSWVWHYNLIRLYNRDAFTMTGELDHDDVKKIKPGASVGRLAGFVHHYSYLSIHQLVAKHNLETDRMVHRAIIQDKNYSPWRMVGAMSLNFLKRYLLDRFFLYGFWGFIYSVDFSFTRFLKFAKFYEEKQLGKYGEPGDKSALP
jgi:glycosyltransferase involved in cell wall biosynthesis